VTAIVSHKITIDTAFVNEAVLMEFACCQFGSLLHSQGFCTVGTGLVMAVDLFSKETFVSVA
jgi:hypothetical protein